jgi:NAD(P)-dependent dehydrogenase (short-subunit alcohol dehydrogenase family)
MQGKAGLVTGAGSGIGRASALALAESGARVMVSGRSEASLQETVALIEESGGTAELFQCDVSDEEQVKALVDATVTVFGRLDFACNSAGTNGVFAPLGDMQSEVWDRVLKINLFGTFYCLKHQVNAMLKTGGGSIVNIASGAGLTGVPNNAPYVASKFGVIGLTRNAAIDYGPHHIRVNAIAPGATATPMMTNAFEQLPPEHRDRLMQATPLRAMTEPEDQADAVVWLCSDHSKMVTGIALPVDGGWLAAK